MTKQPLSSLTTIPLKGSAARPEPIPDAVGEGRGGPQEVELSAASVVVPSAHAEASAVQPLAQVQRPVLTPPPPDDPRSTLAVRVTVTTQERLREMAHRTRRQKQELVEQALVAFMDEHGF